MAKFPTLWYTAHVSAMGQRSQANDSCSIGGAPLEEDTPPGGAMCAARLLRWLSSPASSCCTCEHVSRGAHRFKRQVQVQRY